MSEVIYERKYQRETYEDILKEFEEWERENPEDAAELPFPSYEECYRDMIKNQTLVLLPEKMKKAGSFIRLAIEASETYQMDTKIVSEDSRIVVDYSFDCGADMEWLMPVLRLADSVSFFTGVDGFDIKMSLDYYTHAVYKKNRLVHPFDLE